MIGLFDEEDKTRSAGSCSFDDWFGVEKKSNGLRIFVPLWIAPRIVHGNHLNLVALYSIVNPVVLCNQNTSYRFYFK